MTEKSDRMRGGFGIEGTCGTWTSKKALAVIALLILFQAPAWSETVEFAGNPLSFPRVRDRLLQEFGTDTFPPLGESVFPHFKVDGEGKRVIRFRLLADSGSFQSHVGIYRFGAEMADLDLFSEPGKVAFARMALAPGNATAVFRDEVHDAGAEIEIPAEGGEILGFFLIPDGTLESFRDASDTYALDGTGSQTLKWKGKNRWPLFAYSAPNPDSGDQSMCFAGSSRIVGRPLLMIVWEDLTRATFSPNPMPSDATFADLVLTVEGVTPVEIPR